MWGSYLVRSWKELLRFKGRNAVSLAGITVMIVSLTALLSLLLQIRDIFAQNDSDFVHQLQIIQIRGQRLDEKKLQELAAMEGVEHLLPLSNAVSYPWANIIMGDYAVLPVYVSYYDPQYLSLFRDGRLMKQTLEEQPDAIVSADFGANILSLAEYSQAFGAAQPISLEMMGAAASKLVKQYQTLSLSGEKRNNTNVEITGQTLNISIENKYFADQSANVPSRSTVKITGQLKPDILDLPGNRILLPTPSSRFFVESKERKFFDMVYIKAKSNEALPNIIKQLKARGYSVYDKFDMTKHNTTASSQFLQKISIIMIVILLISILNFINTFHSSIEERRKEIALRKAIGAGNAQILLGYVLEGVLLVSLGLAAGFSLVALGFYALRKFVRTGIVESVYYEAFDLNRSAVEQIFQVPPPVYIGVSAGLYVLCILASALPAWVLVNKTYMSLMKRG